MMASPMRIRYRHGYVLLLLCLLLSALSIGGFLISGNVYFRASSWIRRSQLILKDTGQILKVSPLEEKYCSCAFGDGCSCSLQFKVIGQNGIGHLRLVGTFVEPLSRELYIGGAIWEWNQEVTKFRPAYGNDPLIFF